MSKVVFEGYVNGTKYDSVEEYNKAVEKALAEGRCDAYTKTYATGKPKEGPTPLVQKNMYDGLEYEPFNTYNQILKEDLSPEERVKQIEELYENLDATLEEALETADDFIKSCEPDDPKLLDYVKVIDSYMYEMEKTREGLQAKADRMLDKLDILAMIFETYAGIFNMARKRQGQSKKENKCSESCTCNKEKKDQREQVVKNVIKDISKLSEMPEDKLAEAARILIDTLFK